MLTSRNSNLTCWPTLTPNGSTAVTTMFSAPSQAPQAMQSEWRPTLISAVPFSFIEIIVPSSIFIGIPSFCAYYSMAFSFNQYYFRVVSNIAPSGDSPFIPAGARVAPYNATLPRRSSHCHKFRLSASSQRDALTGRPLRYRIEAMIIISRPPFTGSDRKKQACGVRQGFPWEARCDILPQPSRV